MQRSSNKYHRAKYHAQPTVVDNIRFHSRGEARRYCDLKLLQRAGEITNLKWQVKFPLYAFRLGRKTKRKVCDWIADFTYLEGPGDGVLIVEDFKGYRTQTYKLKKRLFEEQYGIQIRET